MKKILNIFLCVLFVSISMISCSQRNEAGIQKNGKTDSIQGEVRSFQNKKSFSSTVHVLSTKKGNILIDPGHYSEELSEYIDSIGGLDAILITHGHWDNIYALDKVVAANPRAKVYIHELDYAFLHDPVLNCSDINGFSLMLDTKPQTFTEDIYTIGGYTFEIIHTPGHTCGSCIFYFEEENILFGGDTIMSGLVGSAKHPTGDEKERENTIKMFKQLKFSNDMKIFGGHMKNTTYKELMKINKDLQ
jgi:hydroxyacylglutathione hydrolase